MNNVFYKKSQPFNLIIVLSIVSIAVITIWAIKEYLHTGIISYNPIAYNILFLVLLLLFYKLTITITHQFAEVSFGVGILYRKIPIHALDIATARTINVAWYYGVGIRLTPEGTLFNTGIGNNLHIKTKNNRSSFFVSTTEDQAVVNAIKEAQNASNT